MRNYKKVCYYCENPFKLENFGGKFYHPHCYQAMENVAKYRRGEYPPEWYAEDDLQDGRKTRYFDNHIQNMIIEKIKDLKEETGFLPTWKDVKQGLPCSNNTALDNLKRLINKNSIIINKTGWSYNNSEIDVFLE